MQETINDVLAFVREAFHEVNAIQGLIIALVAAFMMSAYRRIFVVAFGATIVHLLVDVLLPVVAHGAAFRLPDLVETYYWRNAGLLFVGYFIVISVFYLIRSMLFRR